MLLYLPADMFHVAPRMWIIVDDGCILYVCMRKRGLCGPVSVCPSVCHVIHRVEDIVKLLSRSGSPIILVFFLLRAAIPNSKGNTVIRGAKYTEGGKILRFSTDITVYLGNGTR